jgi:4'-phosphopantetheinyl transferase
VLASDERVRARRFVRDIDCDLFLVAHAQLRLILSRYEAIAPDRWVFPIGARGRPFIGNENLAQRLHFSLSHVAGLVAIAVSRTPEIGVDVEPVAQRVDEELVARRVFTAREVDWMRVAPDSSVRFATLWTLKEAYSKARGQGLSMDFQRIEFSRIGQDPVATLDPALDDQARRWRFMSTRPTLGHCCAIAAADPGMRVHTFNGAEL